MRTLAIAALVAAVGGAWLVRAAPRLAGASPLAGAASAAGGRSPGAPAVLTRDGVTTIELPDRVVRFDHLPDAVVRWAALPSGALVAVADRKDDPDRSWAASLLLEGGSGVELVDRVFHASKPLVTTDGNIVVERGRAGALTPGRMRVDDLTLDLVDPRGATRTLYRTRGFEAHLVGVVGSEVIVYLIQPDLASLRAVDLPSGRERVIVPSLLPFAADLAIVDGAIELTNRDDDDRALLVRERIDVATGARTRLGTL